jgi:hypothetical protein
LIAYLLSRSSSGILIPLSKPRSIVTAITIFSPIADVLLQQFVY